MEIESGPSKIEDLLFVKKGGGTVLLHEGHQYYKNRCYADGSIIWRCKNKSKGKYVCAGSLKIKNGLILKCKNHCSTNCKPDFAKNELDLQILECKSQASIDFGKTIPEIYKENKLKMKNAGLHFVTKIPKYKQLKNSLYSERNTALGMPKVNFQECAEAVVPSHYTSFLLGDYNCDGRRILVFCSQEMRVNMTIAKQFFFDGTFKSCPKPFKQIFSIHGDFESNENETNVFPMIYALMSDMTMTSYIILFEIILSQIPNWKPLKFIGDFEEASRKAILNVFPTAAVKGCYTHFSNSIWKKGAKFSLDRNKWARRIIGLCTALPLLPSTHIREGWAYIEDQAKLYLTKKDNMSKFMTYFQKFWLKNDQVIESWCVFGERHRTTNCVEAWHNTLNQACKTRKNVTIVRLLKVLHTDAELFGMDAAAIQNNEAIMQRKAESILNDSMIFNAQQELINGNISIGHFLQKMR